MSSSTPKALILCFDGTTNQYSENNTNVAKIYSMLSKECELTEQVTYYQPGIGQYFQPGVVTPMFEWAAQIADYAVAWYLYQHVVDGYQFVIQNWNKGDKIYLFGFSRGAYVARCVAGMIHKIGLIAKDNEQSLAFAYKLYTRTDAEGLALAAGFKRAFSRSVTIEFVGVFDTVASVGLILRRDLPFTATNTQIKQFRHALSLDEHRVRFQPNRYHIKAPTAGDAGRDPNHASSVSTSNSGSSLSALLAGARKKARVLSPNSWVKSKRKATADALREHCEDILNAGLPVQGGKKEQGDGNVRDNPATLDGDAVEGGTVVKEVWFAGCHSDVGGGAVADVVPRSLGDISLRWMIQELLDTNPSIAWRAGAIQELFNEDAARAAEEGRPPLPDLDSLDATQPLNDAFKKNPVWWVLEVLPLSWVWQDDKGAWHRQWRFNLGRGRKIEGDPEIHPTVKLRVQDKQLKYTPRAQWKKKKDYLQA